MITDKLIEAGEKVFDKEFASDIAHQLKGYKGKPHELARTTFAAGYSIGFILAALVVKKALKKPFFEPLDADSLKIVKEAVDGGRLDHD